MSANEWREQQRLFPFMSPIHELVIDGRRAGEVRKDGGSWAATVCSGLFICKHFNDLDNAKRWIEGKTQRPY